MSVVPISFQSFQTWYNPEGIFTLSKILVIPRDGDEPEKMIEEIPFFK